MPLSQDDPKLDYDGSWADASAGWPALEFANENDAMKAYIIAWRDVKIPYGCYVLVGKTLRLETEAQRVAVATACRRMIAVKAAGPVYERGEGVMMIPSTVVLRGAVATIAVEPLEGSFKATGMQIEHAGFFEVQEIKVGMRPQNQRPVLAEVFNILDHCGIKFSFDECLEGMSIVLVVKNTTDVASVPFSGKFLGEWCRKKRTIEGKEGKDG